MDSELEQKIIIPGGAGLVGQNRSPSSGAGATAGWW